MARKDLALKFFTDQLKFYSQVYIISCSQLHSFRYILERLPFGLIALKIQYSFALPERASDLGAAWIWRSNYSGCLITASQATATAQPEISTRVASGMLDLNSRWTSKNCVEI